MWPPKCALKTQKSVPVTYSGARGDAAFARIYAQHDAFGHRLGSGSGAGRFTEKVAFRPKQRFRSQHDQNSAKYDLVAHISGGVRVGGADGKRLAAVVFLLAKGLPERCPGPPWPPPARMPPSWPPWPRPLTAGWLPAPQPRGRWHIQHRLGCLISSSNRLPVTVAIIPIHHLAAAAVNPAAKVWCWSARGDGSQQASQQLCRHLVPANAAS